MVYLMQKQYKIEILLDYEQKNYKTSGTDARMVNIEVT